MRYTSVALTINNWCNMQCGHCYLNYENPRNFISGELLEHILRPGFFQGIKRVIIVGKEPLFNRKSRDVLAKILDALEPMRIEMEIITNGLNLLDFDPSVAHRLSAIDVSLDGGPHTYESYRGAVTLGQNAGEVYPRIIEGIRHLEGAPINILHTLSSVVTDVEDMMHAAIANPRSILFSPFVTTPDVSDLDIVELPMEEMMSLLAGSTSFMANASAFFVLGTHSARGLPREQLRKLTDDYGLKGKVRWIGDSSTYVRISYDGLVTDSATALAPSSYRANATKYQILESIQDFEPTERR